LLGGFCQVPCNALTRIRHLKRSHFFFYSIQKMKSI
jgi:hypothetical protein